MRVCVCVCEGVRSIPQVASDCGNVQTVRQTSLALSRRREQGRRRGQQQQQRQLQQEHHYYIKSHCSHTATQDNENATQPTHCNASPPRTCCEVAVRSSCDGCEDLRPRSRVEPVLISDGDDRAVAVPSAAANDKAEERAST